MKKTKIVYGENVNFFKQVVWLGLHLRSLHDEIPANVIDESIDEALVARTKKFRSY